MKINMPVTDHEVLLPEQGILTSKTDLKGIITWANKEFIEISGFSAEELIGKNHNLIRHPDMPPAVFEDLWNTLKAQRPWTGIIKNRCKNGDYYWVKANVTPIKEKGEVLEYMSVRTTPSREEITAAQELHQALTAGTHKVIEGRSYKTGFSLGRIKLRNISLRQQFMAIGTVVLLLAALVGVSISHQFAQLHQARQEFEGLQHMEPLRALLQLVAEHRGMMAAKLQGDPSFNNNLPALQRQIDAGFAGLDQLTSRQRDQFETAQETARLQAQWQDLKLAADTLSSRASLQSHNELTTSLLDLMNHVGDASRLTLDTELDSFYAIDIITNRLPFLIDTLSQTRTTGTTAIAKGMVSDADNLRLMELNDFIIFSVKRLETAYERGSAASASFKNHLHASHQQLTTKALMLAGEAKTLQLHFSEQTRLADFFSTATLAIDAGHDYFLVVEQFVSALLASRIERLSYLSYGLSTGLLLSVLFVLGVGLRVTHRLFSNLATAQIHFREMAAGNYRSAIEIDANNELSELLRSLKIMQIRAGFNLVNTRNIADEALQLKQALDHVSANVMVADAGRNIIYMNHAITQSLKNAEQDIQQALPDFHVANLIGQSIDTLHKHPAHQAALLAKLAHTHRAAIRVGNRSINLTVNPVRNDEGAHLGFVVEWQDRTAEVAIEQEIAALVRAAANGDLSPRLTLDHKQDFFLKLSEGLNALVSSADDFVGDVGTVFAAMAEGNLTLKLAKTYRGDFDRIKQNANSTIDKLTAIITELHEAANAINLAAGEIAQGNADLSQRTEEQASSLEETAASMEQIAATVKESAEHAGLARGLSVRASQEAQQGGQIVQKAVAAMADTLNASKRIHDIIGVIDEIAFQTNLLALNAAVEAARAGDQGRGFAVVAAEVRNLSRRSASAAKEIKTLIRDSVEKVEAGASLVNASGETLQTIVRAVDEVATCINQVSQAASEQRSGIEQIHQAISQMDEMTQQNAALVEEAAAASESMSEQARNMTQMINFFDTGNRGEPEESGVPDMRSHRQPRRLPSYNTRQAAASPPSSQRKVARFSRSDEEWEDF